MPCNVTAVSLQRWCSARPRPWQGCNWFVQLGTVFLQASNAVVQLLNCPESRETPKWANMRVFHRFIIQSLKARGVFLLFFFPNGQWFIATLTHLLCVVQFFSSSLMEVILTFSAVLSHAPLVWMPWCTITSILSPAVERLFPQLLSFHRQHFVLFEYVGRNKLTPLSDKLPLIKSL